MIKLYLQKEYQGNEGNLSRCALCAGLYRCSDSAYFLFYDVDGKTDLINASFGPICQRCLDLDDATTREYLRIQAKSDRRHGDHLRYVAANYEAITSGCGECSIAAAELAKEYRRWGIPSWEESAVALETAASFDEYDRSEYLVSQLFDDSQKITYNGFVYLLGSPEGYCKIGRTKELNARMHTISLQLPFRVEVLHTIEVSDPVKAERFLHDKFKDCRTNGEWFLLSVEQINWIKSQTTLEGQF